MKRIGKTDRDSLTQIYSLKWWFNLIQLDLSSRGRLHSSELGRIVVELTAPFQIVYVLNRKVNF